MAKEAPRAFPGPCRRSCSAAACLGGPTDIGGVIMKRSLKTLFCLAVLVGAVTIASTAEAGYLMVTNFSSLGRSVMLFNKSDGSLVQKNWIVSDATNVLNSPTEALAIGTDVWISDQGPEQGLPLRLDDRNVQVGRHRQRDGQPQQHSRHRVRREYRLRDQRRGQPELRQRRCDVQRYDGLIPGATSPCNPACLPGT